jgi:ATP-binding cassette subfamily B protein
VEEKSKQKISAKELKKLFSFLRPYKFRVVVVCVCTLVLSFLTVLQPLLRQRLIDDGIVGRNLRTVIVFAASMLILYLLNQIVNTIQFLNYTYINKLMPFNLNYRAFSHLLRLPASFFKNENNTKTIENLNYDITNISRICDSVFITSFVQGVCMIGGIAGLFIINWKLSLLVIIVIPVKILINNFFSSKRSTLFDHLMDHHSKYSEWLGDSIQGVITIKLWNVYRQTRKKFTQLKRNIIKHDYKLAILEQENNIASSVIDEVLQTAFYILGALLIFNDSLTIGGLFSFISYSTYVISAVSFLTRIRFYFDPITPSFRRYTEFMKIEEENAGNTDVPDSEPHISFKNVSLVYEDGTVAVKNATFEIRSGERIAIVGSNGSGKSSNASLLLRLYESTEGDITYCNININEIKIDQFRSIFSQVEQKSFMFNTNIRDNIDPLHQLSDEQIIKTAESLGIAAFITEDNTLDTEVGVDGGKLSGGQRQKLAAIRAFAKPHKILILDEITNNLDIESEWIINDFITQKRDDKILFIITHRIDILKKTDKILFMKDGELTTQGTYEQLMENCSDFYQFINHHQL